MLKITCKTTQAILHCDTSASCLKQIIFIFQKKRIPTVTCYFFLNFYQNSVKIKYLVVKIRTNDVRYSNKTQNKYKTTNPVIKGYKQFSWRGRNVIHSNDDDKNDWLDSKINSEIKREKKSTLKKPRRGKNNKHTEGITNSRGTQQGTKKKSEFKDSIWKL